MIASQQSFDILVERLRGQRKLSLDCETTGLRPFHGDRLFSLIIGYQGESRVEALYFNFNKATDILPDCILDRSHLKRLSFLFGDEAIQWFMHNAAFDLHMLAREGIEIKGEIFCTMTQGRVAYNEHPNYDLGSSLKRIGLEKDEAVENWIEANQAWSWVSIPGKKQRKKDKYYAQVPFPIISAYGEKDGTGCFELGLSLEKTIAENCKLFPEGVPDVLNASRIERRLAKTVHRMEERGIKIDRGYSMRAARYEADRLEKATTAFKRDTGRDYAASPKLFAEIFGNEKDKWAFTEKGNPSFESDALKKFLNPAAKTILEMRDAKSKLDFYNGFLWHADSEDVIHPNLKSTGTRTFRFSSSDPNLQNLTSEDDALDQEFVVRRAFVPRAGFTFYMFDYKSVEYSLMLEYAVSMQMAADRESGVVRPPDFFDVAMKVRDGFDIHQATADLMKVNRKTAKTLNFLLLYGGGAGKLSASLGCSLEEAKRLMRVYFSGLPYVRFMIDSIQTKIKRTGWARNWAGYLYHFPDRNFSFTGPNTIIQGGCAAVIKRGMNEVDEYLLDKKSKLLLSIHDELLIEIFDEEINKIPEATKNILEGVYPSKHIPLRVDLEHSGTSFADKI